MATSARRRRHSARVHLPPLQPKDAFRLVTILEGIVSALWRAHGEAMTAALLHQAGTPTPPGGRHPDPDHDDIDF